MMPKGKLILIGGHEEKDIGGESLTVLKRNKSKAHPHIAILASLISKIPRVHHIIEIIASASSIPEQMEEIYCLAYKTAGFTQVRFIRIEDNAKANDETYLKRIDYCHAVFFTGGNQIRLTSSLNDTKVLKAIKRKYIVDEHFIVAGTSAGAMAIPEIIITGGIIREAIMKDDIKIGTGFNFIAGVIIDSHFIKRGRFARLAHAVILNSSLLGIGLEEDAAIIISNGNEVQCFGSGMIILIDGNEILKTNINSVNDFTPIIAENLKVSILAEGSSFLIEERKVI